MVCMVIVAAMGGAQAYMVKPLLDEIFFKQDHTMLMVVPLGIMAIFLVKGFFYYSYSYLLEKVGQSVIRDLRNKSTATSSHCRFPFSIRNQQVS